MAQIDVLFQAMVEKKAADLMISVGSRPCLKISGEIVPMQEFGEVNVEEAESVLGEIMPERNAEEFRASNDTDFAYDLKGFGRFRCNVFRNRLGMGGVFRLIPSKIVTSEELNLPKSITDLCFLSKGLVVVTGPTGSGKSTTLCAMVDLINRTRKAHLITIEDPIEFVHPNKQCLINQREVGNHTQSFKRALRAALREAPDIVLIGEMRDLETIEIAVETAETGHLVFGTLHTTTAASTVDRLIDQFPADRQQQIRTMLSSSLKGVIAQNLLKKKAGGRIAALEILLITNAMSSLIREGKTYQIPSQMTIGKKLGMQTLNDSLVDLVKKDTVTPEEAYVKAVDKDEFVRRVKEECNKIVDISSTIEGPPPAGPVLPKGSPQIGPVSISSPPKPGSTVGAPLSVPPPPKAGSQVGAPMSVPPPPKPGSQIGAPLSVPPPPKPGSFGAPQSVPPPPKPGSQIGTGAPPRPPAPVQTFKKF